MKVVLYNRWLATLGGGETMSLNIAEYLSHQHEVTLVSHTRVTPDEIKNKLRIDLSKVKFEVIPDQPAEKLGGISEGYDLFINVSYMDFVPPRAKRNAMLVFFPTPIELSRMAQMRRAVGKQLLQRLMIPQFVEGVYGAELWRGSQLRRTAQTVRVILPASARSYQVTFDLASQVSDVTRAVFSANGVMQVVNLPADQTFVPCAVHIPASTTETELKLVADTDVVGGDPPFKLAITRFELAHPAFRTYQLIFERWLKEWGLRLHGVVRQNEVLDTIRSYDHLWAISDFTAKWIKRYWGCDSRILNPPVAVQNFSTGEKKHYILNVGRFFAGSHNKKHLVMIEAFKQMVDAGLQDWELHMAGSVEKGSVHQEYLQRVQKAAVGYPIKLHVNIPFDELRTLYASSAIYWHASGFDEDESKEPIKSEHFGITTVEAMASGCVPVVIGKGGQPEIVRDAVDGYLWTTLDQLKNLTLKVIKNDSLRHEMSQQAALSSQRYGKQSFDLRVQELISQLF